MVAKKALLEFESDTNQLAYSGTPGHHADYTVAVTTEAEESFDNDGVPQQTRRFFLSWPAVDESHAPIYARFRIRNESYNAQSLWSLPQLLYVPVRYSIYKRRVVNLTPNPWVLLETTTAASVGGYQENWAGRVQYAVCIHHKNATPASTEGIAWTGNYPTDVVTPYVLFMTNPDSATFDTKPLVVAL